MCPHAEAITARVVCAGLASKEAAEFDTSPVGAQDGEDAINWHDVWYPVTFLECAFLPPCPVFASYQRVDLRQGLRPPVCIDLNKALQQHLRETAASAWYRPSQTWC